MTNGLRADSQIRSRPEIIDGFDARFLPSQKHPVISAVRRAQVDEFIQIVQDPLFTEDGVGDQGAADASDRESVRLDVFENMTM